MEIEITRYEGGIPYKDRIEVSPSLLAWADAHYNDPPRCIECDEPIEDWEPDSDPTCRTCRAYDDTLEVDARDGSDG